MLSRLKRKISTISFFRYYSLGKNTFNDVEFINTRIKSKLEYSKPLKRTEVINYLLSIKEGETNYLEIGVRNPDDNFNLIHANFKISVDPGYDFTANPVDFKITSDEFFRQLFNNEILNNELRFDVIFIDGSHLADQVLKDINNSLHFLKDDGFIVLHDCNPPTEWHARESYKFYFTGAGEAWSGTTWKAFLMKRFSQDLYSCCIDSDWGIGILSKKYNIGNPIEKVNPFFEFRDFDRHRKQYLNLIEFSEFKAKLSNYTIINKQPI